VWRIVLVLGGASEGRLRGTDTVADMLMVGCLLAIVMLRNSRIVGRPARWLAAPAALLLLIVVVQPVPGQIALAILPSVLAVASAVVVAHTVTAPQSLMARVLAWRPLLITGRLSYAIYLWHLPVTIALTGHIPNRWLLTLAVAAVSVPAAAMSWVFIERPALRLKERFEASPFEPPVLTSPVVTE
jgi:peptidoglycan/LPS O-acetylase OafA/YrhL